MVIQRSKPILLFGTAEPYKKFTIRMSENEKYVSSDGKGNWNVELESVPIGGPYEINIIFQQKLTLCNILYGDVYLCSGQSNMEMQLDGWGRVNNFKNEIATANYDNIRLLKVDYNTSLNEQKEIKSSGWKVCSSESVAGFSAVAYFYAKELVNDINMPIGLIQSTWPGSPIEAWMSKESLSQYNETEPVINKLISNAKSEQTLVKNFVKDFNRWQNEIAELEPKELNENWTDRFDWHPIKLPYMWQQKDFPEFNGSVWFRKNIELPINDSREDYLLNLGPVKDSYSLWINGKLIKTVSSIEFIREHIIPRENLQPGNNEVVVRVFAEQYGGGFWGEDDEIKIYNSTHSISLSSEWDAAKGVDLNRISDKPKNPTDIDVPTVLFNAMIYPLTRLNIKGILWYQGESNVDEPKKYEKYFKALITDWRRRFSDENIPFLFAELANYNDENDVTNEQWARLREAQEKSLELENTGMVCSIDLGESDDIHPQNKQDIGIRLALLAKKMIYNRDVLSTGPKYLSHQIKNNSIVVDWSMSGKSLVTNDNLTPREFIIASNNKKFYKANTVIDNNKTVLTSKEVTNPIAVRYAWSNNPFCNLTDESGLPALPFRTDNW
jgi:sialate O-acetylesterase